MADQEARHTWQLHREMPFEMRAAMGHVANARTVFVFGHNPDVQNVEETVWYHGGIYQYPAAALQMSVSSNDAACTATIMINGLDANYAEISEMITLTGQTPVTTVRSYLRIQSAYVMSNPTTQSIYIGTGTVTAGVPATVYERIFDGDNRSQSGMFTVPAGYTLYIPHGTISHGSDSAAYITGRFRYRLLGMPFQTAAKVNLNNNYIDFNWHYPVALPEKTDVTTTAICSKQQVNAVSVSFEGILVQEEQ